MRTFLIQTENNLIKHDFSFHLHEAIQYQNWYHRETVYGCVLSETIDSDKLQGINIQDIISVGSLEFVLSFLEKHHEVSREKITPLNLPLELQTDEFLKREVFIATKTDEQELPLTKEMFVKSNDMYKGFVDVIDNSSSIPNGNYLVSDVVDFQSEWRCFIQNGELVGIHPYLGDFTLFPDVALIKKMIATFKDCPRSYTLDVGVTDNGTSLVEVHPFVSCGLYGFRDAKRLPSMFIQGFDYFLKQAKK